jgi:hypothetical protein
VWIAPLIDKKVRLGIDRRATDEAIRHVMRPVEEVFAKEYADSDPFPFGQQRWIQTLVRSIVLAEPMIKDFEDCFADVADDATVVVLAESFRFGNCVRRQRLADLIASKTPRPKAARS